ncbi:deoxyguanosinetriphosphate triphosphohydrolase [Nocardioides caldifontis]|uniref:deoxyguanosinetriphosphate triphosphohydrolase n=1 Tax=Nocardioides caldifontis TaxID=2588938 RepID=UPI0011E04A1D|nr:deoxyguanosinetriphosphate triphosphohydrolase [Nocardioides caldifontis]
MGSTERYDDAARARFVDEPRKHSTRTPFERDRARVVHSAALRRLAAKTQVVGPQSDDFVRNRLTHTLEVAQVARDLARQLGCDADVVETAALAHDLGHPPFGHNGERALDEVSGPAGGFEGNAQTLRLLTRLEAKSTTPDGRSAGLNLTRASLDAATKYPWPRRDAAPPVGAHADGTPRSVAKFGVYDDDVEVFAWLREGVPPRRRCLEAQVMDLADDVAYSVHDVEDGVVAGRVDLLALGDPGLRRDVWRTVQEWYLPSAEPAALDAALDRLASEPGWPTSAYDGSRGDLAALKNLTSDLIGRFCRATTEATHEQFGGDPLTRYAADLVVPHETLLEITVLKGVAAHLVMRAEDRMKLLARQQEVVRQLVEALVGGGPELLEPRFRPDLEEAPDEAARLRVVVDQVASLTDASAWEWHARLCRPAG